MLYVIVDMQPIPGNMSLHPPALSHVEMEQQLLLMIVSITITTLYPTVSVPHLTQVGLGLVSMIRVHLIPGFFLVPLPVPQLVVEVHSQTRIDVYQVKMLRM